MSQLIYTEMDALLSPPLQEAVDQADGEAREAAQKALEEARVGWQKLAYAVATGVVSHLLANLEIRNIQTRGDVSIAVSGATAAADGHQHNAGTLQGTQNNLTFDQSNDGPGLIA